MQYELNSNLFPNIISSYVTENVFGNSNWLSEGVYKDILDGFDYKPRLKINIVDSEQTFVPFFTGNINFLSSGMGNYWYLYIRFPKTTITYRWKSLVYSQDIPRMSKAIEKIIFSNKDHFYDKANVDGSALYALLESTQHFLYERIQEDLRLPGFSLPYYEGFNRYENKNWLGIYRRDEIFNVGFLQDICKICLQTKIGQLYTTPWKSLIVKGIENRDRKFWDYALGKYRINVRHASNELNWQIEDDSEEGLNLKRYLIRQFDKEDVRTFGLCFAIKTQPKTGLFGSVVIRKLINDSANQRKTLDRFEILYTKDFNPNSKDYILFRKNIEKENLGVYLVSLCKYFYELQSQEDLILHEVYQQELDKSTTEKAVAPFVFQCRNCLTIYDSEYGDDINKIPVGKNFAEICESYHCPTCDSPKSDFVQVEKIPLIV
ncbi:MAG: rubredoxin [Flavitalea sp.]